MAPTIKIGGTYKFDGQPRMVTGAPTGNEGEFYVISLKTGFAVDRRRVGDSAAGLDDWVDPEAP